MTKPKAKIAIVLNQQHFRKAFHANTGKQHPPIFFKMKESFLQFIWRYRRIEERELFTTQREPIQILDHGYLNKDAGPDFLNARIKVGVTLWAGNVEIHIKASDWLRHGHQEDSQYQNVILHVVWEEDEPIVTDQGVRIPCLELKPITSPSLFKTYKKLASNGQKIPCQAFLPAIPQASIQMWLERLLIERLEDKVTYWESVLVQRQFDWEQVFFEAFAKSLGLPVNPDAMQQLVERTPLRLLQKHRDQLAQLEALLFGQAGLLREDFREHYPQQLYQEYQFLRHKYQLNPLSVGAWKYARMRPSNFPDIRIAQLAQLIFQSNYLFSKMLSLQNVEEAYQMLSVKVVQYWQSHYRLDEISTKKMPKRLGKSTIDRILINGIAPLLFLYGKYRDQPQLKEKALDLLAAVSAEKNSCTRDWAKRQIEAQNAGQSQALLQLYKQYCRPKKCLQCAIGVSILKNGTPTE